MEYGIGGLPVAQACLKDFGHKSILLPLLIGLIHPMIGICISRFKSRVSLEFHDFGHFGIVIRPDVKTATADTRWQWGVVIHSKTSGMPIAFDNFDTEQAIFDLNTSTIGLLVIRKHTKQANIVKLTQRV